MAVRNSLVAAVEGHQLTAARGGKSGADKAGIAADLDAASAIVGHRFGSPELLREALTHRSAIPGRPIGRGRTASPGGAGSNERLEFVGDRVLGLLVAEWLGERFPHEQEGPLARRLAHLVAQPMLAGIGDALGLPAVLAVAPGEARAGVRTRATVLADAMEALIGALYLDGGLDAARAFVRRAWAEAMEAMAEPPKDPKTELQEWLLARGQPLPQYELVSRAGPPHDPVFVIAVDAAGRRGEGRAGSKRAAERLAAAELLARLVAA